MNRPNGLWEPDRQLSALPRCTLHLKPAADQVSPFTHPQQAKVAVGCKVRGAPGHLKADPIITNFQEEPFRIPVHAQVYPVRASVLDCIMQRLLCNAVEFLFDPGRKAWFVAQLGLDRYAVTCAEGVTAVGARVDHPPYGTKRNLFAGGDEKWAVRWSLVKIDIQRRLWYTAT